MAGKGDESHEEGRVNGDLPPEVEPLQPEDPSAIGGYRLLGRLGIGGMGAVYLAFDGLRGQMVAIKTLHPALADNPELRLRFKAERDFGRRVSSFFVPSVLDDGMDGSHPYIVTEYVKGISLAERVHSGGPLADDALEAVAIAVSAALVAIHTAGLVHRDVKPANVLLSPDGPKVIDFGIARDLEAAGALTQTGVVMGSPGWIAPERLAGRPGSRASDIFGWGGLVAFAATGRPPFGSGSAAERTELILSGRPELTGLREPWHGLVNLALDKDPQVRPDADDLLQTLLAQRGRPALHSTAETIADLWTIPEPAVYAETPTSPPQPLLPSPPPSKRRATATAWTITAVAVTIALAVSIAGAANPDPAAGLGNGSAARPAKPPTTPAEQAPAPPDPIPSDTHHRAKAAPDQATSANRPRRTTSPPSRGKAGKHRAGKAHSGKK
jgi:serine/threonine protein kinase